MAVLSKSKNGEGLFLAVTPSPANMAYSTSGGRMSGEGPALKKRPSPEQCANCWRCDNGNTRPGGPRRRHARAGRVMPEKKQHRRPQADRRGTASAVRRNPFPRPPGGCRGDREVGLRSGPISRGETKNSNLKGCCSSFRSGERTRTSDLRVMSPTSYRLLYPAMWIAKVGIFFLFAKLKTTIW